MRIFQHARLGPEHPHQFLPEVNGWPSRVTAGLDRIIAGWTARRRAARDIQELYAFSTRELRDMGLNRSDLPAVARGSYRRD